MDFVPRTRAALDALSGVTGEGDVPAATDPVSEPSGVPIWEALVVFARAVPRLGALDPVTSEVVRLRGARQHRCRLCQSLRSRPALLAGGDEEMFLAVDDYERSDLTPVQKAALAFTDAMIWTPGRITGPARRLSEFLSPEQGVELVFDVTRNALNKVAVALDANGDPLYGLTLD
jgi:alkylhydroperoxidase family enzyme